MTMKMFSAALVFVLGCAGPSGTGTSSGGTGGTWGWTTGGSGGGGAGGSGGGTGGETTTSTSTGTTTSTPTVTDTTMEELKELCASTGGTVQQAQCCSKYGQMPDTCMNQVSCGGVITCSGGIDPDLWVCSCSSGMCFDQTEGCTVPG